MMNIELKRIGKELYFEQRVNNYLEPVCQVIRWKAQGPTFRVPEEQIGKIFPLRPFGAIHQARIPAGPFGAVELWIEGKQMAESNEAIPIPAPKVRKGIQTRYHDGGWQKYTARDGWIPA